MAETDSNSRLEAFCDGVFAIALTLLVLDIKIPSRESIKTTNDLWLAFEHVAPSILTFLLSFTVILITWVNHHAALRLVNKSSASFLYANGFLLLTIVFLPFPTALLGEFLLTDHAAPAVIVYTSTLACQSMAWVLLSAIALKNELTKDERSTVVTRGNRRAGYFALTVYSLFTITAFFFPLAIAIATAMIWVGWLIYGINISGK
jgi:uncharacterized membrane protein